MRNAKICLLISAILFSVLPAHASMEDDPVIYSIAVEELEWRDVSAGDALAWDLQAWVGKDRDKLLLKSEGERVENDTEDFEAQLLYNRAIASFWDLQVGWRHDWQPVVERDWFALGVAGELPGFIHTEATAFYGDGGRAALRLKGSYKLFFTQRLSLQPQLEANWYSDDDRANGIGSGLASVEFGLRLHYAWRPNLQPYAGINWAVLSGTTGDLAEAEGESDSDLQALVGISWMF
jgi:copper resistance protein B